MEHESESCCKHGISGPAVGGMFWFVGWWFTIGFAKLVWWKAIIAVVLWGYYLGAALR